MVDRNLMLVDFWDDDKTEGIRRLKEDFGLQQDHDDRGGVMGVFVPLTTPIAYLTSIPLDPFAKDDSVASYISTLIVQDKVPPHSYFYIDDEATWNDRDHGCRYFDWRIPDGRLVGVRPIKTGHFATMGLGPIQQKTYQEVGIPYDPTNGTASYGMVVRYDSGGDK